MMRCSDSLPQVHQILSLCILIDVGHDCCLICYSERLIVLELYNTYEIDTSCEPHRIAAFPSAEDLQSGLKFVEGGDI